MAKIIPTDFGIDERDWLQRVGERQVRDWRWVWLRYKTVPVYGDGWRLISVVSSKEHNTDRSSDEA